MKFQRIAHNLLAAAVFTAAAACPAAAFAADPFIGKWVMDTSHSKYPTGLPEHMTIEMEETPKGIHYHSETLMRSGGIYKADYTALYDDKPVIFSGGNRMLLPVSLHRDGEREVTARYIRGWETMATSKRVLSADGKTMTVTTTSTDGTGLTVTNVGVYHRQSAAFDLSKAAAELKTTAR